MVYYNDSIFGSVFKVKPKQMKYFDFLILDETLIKCERYQVRIPPAVFMLWTYKK